MKKLKNKTFIVIFGILTLFLVSLLIIYNYSLYRNEYKDLESSLKRIDTTHNMFFPNDKNPNNDRNPMFMDLMVYVVSFDRNYNIRYVVNYANNDLTNEEIKYLAIEYLEDNNKNGIGNLYFNKYLYKLNMRNELIIIDNSLVNQKLWASLRFSFILLILLEILIGYISILITKWLIRPVADSFEKQKQFIYDASHELKTPLAVIMASAETLENNKEETKWLDNIKSESARMNKLVIDLLELSKSEDVNNYKTYSEIDLSRLIEKSTLTFESLAFEKGLTLTSDIDELIKFKCDSDKIKELLGILIDNAIKHGLEESKINIKLTKEKELIILEVKNRGKAIPKEDREKIFERFYRVDESRNRNENRYGLGLAIAKNIVNNHNGNISVDCKNGYTTFKVVFKQV